MSARQISFVSLLILAGATLSTRAGAQSVPAGIDCAKAKLGVEKEICASPDLIRLDAEVASAYASARQMLDAQGKAALSASQKNFIEMRNLGEVALDFELKSFLQRRVTFLRSIRASKGAWVGTWADDNGTIVLTKRSDGLYDVKADASDPAGGRWTCEFEHGGKVSGATLSTVHRSKEEASEDPHDGWTLVMSKQGDALKVKARPGPDKSIPNPFCGVRGSLDGTYFPANPN